MLRPRGDMLGRQYPNVYAGTVKWRQECTRDEPANITSRRRSSLHKSRSSISSTVFVSRLPW